MVKPSTKTKKNIMPVIFIGHGSPKNAMEKNEFTITWREIAKRIPTPKAILCISAHWAIEKTEVIGSKKPEVIYDFYGFDEELYKIKYPASGSPETAKLVKSVVKESHVDITSNWGLDHGTWSVLVHLFPKADIPVLQLSIDESLPLASHVKIGSELKKLREEGILILGSGNIVHNLMKLNPGGASPKWALDFDQYIQESLLNKDEQALTGYEKHRSAIEAVPTNEHFIPLLYVFGASDNEDPEFFNEQVIYSSLSMRCVAYGLKK